MNRTLAVIAFAITFLITVGAQATTLSPTDSLVIRFANRTRLVIYAPDKAGIQALSNYDLNKIIREMGMKLDSLQGGETAILQDGERFLKDTALVVTRNKKKITIVINNKGDTTRTETTQNDDNYNDYDYKKAKRRKRDRNNFDYGISVGLNSLIQQSANSAYPENSYALRPIGSRYIALSAGAMPTLINGKSASLKLYYGIEVAWNNFMFEDNVFAEKSSTGIAFTAAGRELRKSKLTVATIGIPVVPRVTFYNSSGKKIGHIGLGGYANYRLDSYRKIKEADGSKDRRHSDFYLNNFRYGLMAHLGIRSLNFFVKYDLNPLFQDGKGPDVRTVSFGIGF